MTEEEQTVNNNPKKRNNRKWARRGLLLLLSPVILILTLSVLLYVPFIQDFAVRQASSIASEATGMTIQIQKIRLSFPLDLTIRKAQAIRQPGDTLFSMDDLRVRIHALPLFKKQVMVEAIELNKVIANTGDLIDGLEIKGSLGHLFLKMDRAYLPTGLAVLNEATLSDAAITLIIRETEPKPETPSEPINWKLRLEKVRLDQIALALQMPDDSLRLTTYIENSQLDNGLVDLGNLGYEADRFTITNTALSYDANYDAPINGLDPNHIAIDSLNVALDSLYYQDKTIRANLTRWTLNERSGLRIEEFKGKIDSDPTTIRIPELILRTAYSEAGLTAEIPWSSIDTKASGQMTAQLSAAIGPQDLFALTGDAIPSELKPHYPTQPLEMAVGINGNLETLVLNKANAMIGGVLDLRLDGKAEALTDSLRRLADLRVDLRLGDLDFLKSLLSSEQRSLYQIPRGITLKGNVGMAGTEYRTKLALYEGRSTIAANGRYDIATERYEASLSIDSLEPTHFMPYDSLYWVAGKIQAEGQGTDPFSSKTTMRLDGNIYDIRYGASSLADIRIGSTLENHFLNLELVSEYPLAQMEINLNADVRKERLKAMLIVDAEHIDLHQMHFTSMPLSSSFQIFAEAESDLKEDHLLDITLGNWELVSNKGSFKPKTLTLHTRSTADTSRVSFHAGDLNVTMSGDKGINGLLEDFNKLSTSVDKQLKQDSTINLAALRPLLPHLNLEVGIGQDNPVSNYLKSYEILFDQLDLYAETSPENGLSLRSSLNKLAKDTLLIDSIRTTITQDSLGLNYLVRVAKEPYRRQKPFTAGLEGKIRLDYADALFHFQDETADTSFLIGIQMNKIAEGFRFHLFPETPIIALRPFKINKDNYVDFFTLRNIHANLRMTGEQDASLWLYSTEVTDTLSELHAELSHVDLAYLARSINYLPDIAGTLSADLQYLPSDTSFMAVSNIFIDELFYEKERVGELMANAVYLPLAQNEHQADLHLFRDEQEIVSVNALYTAGDEERIQGDLTFYHLPLAMADPFIPEDMAKLHGDLDGSLAISGNSQAPILDGFLALDSVSVYVGAVGSTFRFDNKNVEIKSNKLTFDKYGIYSTGKTPFIIDGTIDFNQMDNPMANLRLTANNLELLNTKKKPESLVYGKLYVNLNSTLTGPLNLLKMRGDLQLLGGTNITYILKDSPLTVQDRLADMVTFTSFADTLYHETTRKPPLPLGGMDMLMTIRIDPVVQANVDLSEDQSSHINLIGGGDLSFQYTPQGDMILNGQYTLSGGTIKYAMPVIPLKEFSIQNGSYVLWNGNPMDPLLNLTATERVRTSVSSNGQSPRMVNFDVGIEIQQRLENLGLNFTLTAPEDLSMQEELTAKGSEERAKLAVSMLVTGLYLGSTTGSNGKVNLDMGDALNSFLQSEINSIAGSALKTVDISFGMDTYDDNVNGVAGSRTDYSFRFAKRFYNDRIQVILGGRISTGENINNGQAQPFIDNVSVEYRLDNSGSRYVKLFHNKNYESLLEGEITETGAGIVLRRKMMHLRELFNFKKKKVKPINEEEKEE